MTIEAAGPTGARDRFRQLADEQVLERLPRFIVAAERWLHELGSDRQSSPRSSARSGDAFAVAYQSLRDGLQGGEASSVAEFDLRLRQHFDAFLLGKRLTPVPIWKVKAPRTRPTQPHECGRRRANLRIR